jgi:hypothetical protein
VIDVHVCPPVSLTASEPEVRPMTAVTQTRSPLTIEPGGVMTTGEVVFVPLSAGFEAEPNLVIAMDLF